MVLESIPPLEVNDMSATKHEYDILESQMDQILNIFTEIWRWHQSQRSTLERKITIEVMGILLQNIPKTFLDDPNFNFLQSPVDIVDKDMSNESEYEVKKSKGFQAYLASKQKRIEVYRRLAES